MMSSLTSLLLNLAAAFCSKLKFRHWLEFQTVTIPILVGTLECLINVVTRMEQWPVMHCLFISLYLITSDGCVTESYRPASWSHEKKRISELSQARLFRASLQLNSFIHYSSWPIAKAAYGFSMTIISAVLLSSMSTLSLSDSSCVNQLSLLLDLEKHLAQIFESMYL